jgi:hypothetical protein
MEGITRYLLFLFFGLKVVCPFAQHSEEFELEQVVEQRIESISSLTEEGSEIDYSSLTEDLNYFARHKLNLNSAEIVDLQALVVLSDAQINSLFRHISKYGKLKSIFELQSF